MAGAASGNIVAAIWATNSARRYGAVSRPAAAESSSTVRGEVLLTYMTGRPGISSVPKSSFPPLPGISAANRGTPAMAL